MCAVNSCLRLFITVGRFFVVRSVSLFLFWCFIFLSRVFSVFSFFFSSRRRHTRWTGDWSSDVCSSDLGRQLGRACAEDRDSAVGSGLRGVVVPVGVLADERDEEAAGPGLPTVDDHRTRRDHVVAGSFDRSEERRVGKESRTRGGAGP